MHPARAALISRFAAVLVAGLLALLSTLPAAAEPTGASGVVTAMTGGELPTVLTLTQGRTSFDATITADTAFRLGGVPDDSFRDDPFRLWGRYLQATVDSETRVASSVDVSVEFTAFGPVTHVSAAAPPARVTFSTAFGGPVTVNVTEQTVASFNNGPLEDLRDLEDLVVFVSYDPTSLNALTVGAYGGLRRTRGRIVSVDPSLAELVIRRSDGEELFLSADMFPTIEDGSEAKVLVEGVDATLEELQVGMEIVADWENVDFNHAWILQARSRSTESLSGRVQGSSLTGQTLVVGVPAPPVRPQGQVGQVVRITSATRVTLRGRRITLARVPVGSRVKVQSVRQDGQLFARQVSVQAGRRR